MFLRKYFVTNFTFNGNGGMKSTQELHPYTSKSYIKDYTISHYVDISYVFLYLIFRPFKFIDKIKTVTLFITYAHLQFHIYI